MKAGDQTEVLKVISFLILITACILVAVGNINMFGISQKLGQKAIFEKYSFTSILVVLSMLFGFLLGKRPERSIIFLGYALFIISFALLVLVEFLGVQKYGARRWIQFSGVSIHPTELIKVPITLIMSYHLAYRRLKDLILISIPVAIVPSVFVLRHPDYGSAASILFILAIAFFISDLPTRIIAFFIVLAGLAIPIVWEHGLKDYHRKRIIGLLEQEERSLEIAYQTVQSKIAIASGGLYGAGIGKGEHGSGQWIPNLHTDFALASIAEDLGFIGSTTTISLFMILITVLFIKVVLSDSKFARTLCVLSSAIVFFHAFVNIGMVSGVLPVIGIPLPIISYAGTHNVSISFLLGLCAGIPGKPRGLIRSS